MESKEEKIQPLRACFNPIPRSYPWLVFTQEERQIFFDVSNHRWYKESILEMIKKDVYVCSHGWYVLVDQDSYACCLFNPISLEKIQLPSMETNYYHLCILSLPPCDPACHILFIEYGANSFMFCKLGDAEFTKQEIEDVDSSKIMAASLIGETIYCLIYRENSNGGVYILCTILFIGLEVQFTYVITEQQFLQEAPNRFWPHLVAGCDQIFLVLKVLGDSDISPPLKFIVFAMDSSKKQWVKLRSLGDRTIFLSDESGMICLAADSKVQADSIYYTLFGDRHLYVFDFKNQTITMSLPCPILSNYWRLDWTMM